MLGSPRAPRPGPGSGLGCIYIQLIFGSCLPHGHRCNISFAPALPFLLTSFHHRWEKTKRAGSTLPDSYSIMRRPIWLREIATEVPLIRS